MYYATFLIVGWVDIFTRKVYRDIVVDSLQFCQKKKGLEIYAFVVMSNHIHAILRSSTGKLSDTIREFKSFTAKQMLESINQEPESRREWMLNIFSVCSVQTQTKRKLSDLDARKSRGYNKWK